MLVIFIFLLADIAFCQINGKVLMDSEGLFGISVQLGKSKNVVMTDFDGKFSLLVGSSKKVDLSFYFSQLILIIKNIELVDHKLNLGNIHLPNFKMISIAEYKKLGESEKANYIEINHYVQLLGYMSTNELENNYLDLGCEEKMTEFEFDSSIKTITVDWEQKRKCK